MQVQLFPNTRMTFVNNSASQFGGAIAVQNYRDANDITLILNNNCFVQYNIGCENDNNPFEWTVSIKLQSYVMHMHHQLDMQLCSQFYTESVVYS